MVVLRTVDPFLIVLISLGERAIGRSYSSLKERSRVKSGPELGFCGFAGCVKACVTGVSCFPVAANFCGERPVRSRTGRSPAAAGGAGGVLEVAGRVPDDLAAGKREPGVVRGVRLFRSVPWAGLSGCGSAAGCVHPFACPRPGPGGMGRVRVRGLVRRGRSQRSALPPGGGGAE